MKNVILDPGHPSHQSDQGCKIEGYGYESQYAFRFCEYLERRIKLSLEPLTVYKTRESINEIVSHEVRGQRAHEASANLSLSVHVNSYETTELHGAMAFALSNKDITTCELGDRWLQAQPPPLYVKDRKTYLINPQKFRHKFEKRVARVLQLLPEPALLLELAFASNPIDRDALLDARVQSGMIAACMVLLARFRQLKGDVTYPLFGDSQ